MLNRPIAESYWVEEKYFLAGEYPGSYNLENTRGRINAFLEAGINTFIDLTQPGELPSYESILKEQALTYHINASYQRFAIRDHSVPSHGTMTAILDVIDDAISNHRAVYVHCWGGVGRAGITVGCYFIRHGLSHEKALLRVDTLFKTRPQTSFDTSPETLEQFEFVRNWREIPNPQHKTKQNFCEG